MKKLWLHEDERFFVICIPTLSLQREPELIQYRRPVGSGPSANTCPK